VNARITVIVPTYNRSAYLGDALESVLSQDFGDVRLVVADNASEDETPSIVARLHDDRIDYVRRERNIGWRENFNRALRDVRSEYVSLIGDDDRLLPGALTRAVQALDAAPNAGLLHTAFQIIDDHGAVVLAEGNWTGRATEDRFESGLEFIERSMPVMSRVCFPTVVMRTSAMPTICFEAADGTVGDYILWLRIALAWDVGFLATPGAAFRMHADRMSNNFGTNAGAEHVFEPEACLGLEVAKLRFLAANASRLPDIAALRRSTRQCTVREMVVFASTSANDGRGRGGRAISRVVRAHWALVLVPGIWRAGMKVLLGPRIVQRLRRGMRSGRGGAP
jgi:glycosyltransferase involved in cell wall biosynthesis